MNSYIKIMFVLKPLLGQTVHLRRPVLRGARSGFYRKHLLSAFLKYF